MVGWKDDLQEKLSRYRAKVGEDRRKEEEEATKKREPAKRWADAFRTTCEAKIVPVLASARTLCVNADLESSVTKKYDVDPPLVALEVELRGLSTLIYTAIKGTSDIRVSREYNYYSGSGKEIDRIGLNAITPEIVQSHVKEFLEAGMKRVRPHD